MRRRVKVRLLILMLCVIIIPTLIPPDKGPAYILFLENNIIETETINPANA